MSRLNCRDCRKPIDQSRDAWWDAAENEVMCFEFSQRNPQGGVKPSGIAASKAFWWAIEFVEGRWLILPTEELRQLGRLEYGRRRRTRPNFAGVPMGDNGNVGVLLPLATLIDPFLITPEDRRGQGPLRSVAA
jgi:hypothetical protein